MKYLISTEPDDTHAILTKIALEDRGHPVRLFFTADQPTKQRNSVFIDEKTYQWKCADQYESILDNHYDVVWWRRARKPYLPEKITHPADKHFVVKENMLFYESLTNNLAPQAWWINAKEAAIRANSKLLQLTVAKACGLCIPPTLFSNDPLDIRYFLLKHEQEGVIYKPLCSKFWLEAKQLKVAYTSRVRFSELPPNPLLQVSPGIFQKEIKKKYELRVTCFGHYLVAAKLNSQAHPDGKMDWRAIPEKEMEIEPYTMPSALEEQIRSFMKKMGIIFGCMDFIVDLNGNYIFLEVNEQGQFLWLEEYNPDLCMLDMFVNFMLHRTVHFHWEEKNKSHTIEQYRGDMVNMVTHNVRHHVYLNHIEETNQAAV